jgi:lysophospholipase L1-like esterase
MHATCAMYSSYFVYKCISQMGFSGGNIFSLLDDPHNRLEATLRAFPADVIILQIGGNDIDHKEFDISLYKASVRHR